MTELHLLYLPKDGSAPTHRAYADLKPQPADLRKAEIDRLKARELRALFEDS
jgi:hypothetical protein